MKKKIKKFFIIYEKNFFLNFRKFGKKYKNVKYLNFKNNKLKLKWQNDFLSIFSTTTTTKIKMTAIVENVVIVQVGLE